MYECVKERNNIVNTFEVDEASTTKRPKLPAEVQVSLPTPRHGVSPLPLATI
jgi:hypothetical protein